MTPAEELHRLELQIIALHNFALDAAEASRPGFKQVLERALDRHRELAETTATA